MRLRPLLIIPVALLVAACTVNGGTVSPDPDKPTLTKAQAVERVEQLIQQTTAMIDPKPSLEIIKTSLIDGHCLNDSKGRSQVSREYHLNGIPKDQLVAVADRVRAYWERQGHVIVGIGRDKMSVTARSQPDDYYLALVHADEDRLYLGATS